MQMPYVVQNVIEAVAQIQETVWALIELGKMWQEDLEDFGTTATDTFNAAQQEIQVAVAALAARSALINANSPVGGAQAVGVLASWTAELLGKTTLSSTTSKLASDIKTLGEDGGKLAAAAVYMATVFSGIIDYDNFRYDEWAAAGLLMYNR